MLVAAVCGGPVKRLHLKIQDYAIYTTSIKIRYLTKTLDAGIREIADPQRNAGT